MIAGSGSELHFCVEAGDLLKKKGWDCRVVSVPSWTLFDEQPAEYRNQVLCISDRKKGAILTAYVEAASTFGKLPLDRISPHMYPGQRYVERAGESSSASLLGTRVRPRLHLYIDISGARVRVRALQGARAEGLQVQAGK